MYKVSTIDWGFCNPKHLDAVINDFRIQASNRKTVIARTGDSCFPPTNCPQWAYIGIERRRTEYKVILNYYYQV